MMDPIIARTWQTDGNRIGIVWRIFGIRVFGYSFLPWEVPNDKPWHIPDEALEMWKRQEGK